MKLIATWLLSLMIAIPAARADCPDLDASRERWAAFVEELRSEGSKADGEAPFRKLAARYCEPHRAYHTLRHIQHALREFDQARELAHDPEAVELALWFHDVVYDIGGADNEGESAWLGRESARVLGLSEERAERVSDLILATRHNAVPSTGDAELVVDIDLSILGQPWERFDAYEDEIRIEYAPVIEARGAAGFNAGRARILRRFLDRPAIYSTEHFQQKYEEAARGNLRRSIERLEDPAWTEAVGDRQNQPDS